MEVILQKVTIAAALAFGVSGCVATAQEPLAVSCSEYIGKPITRRIASLGPPKQVYRINPTQIGYVFESRETTYVGGYPYYTVNYLTGADKHYTPIRPVTTTCQGLFVTWASSDTVPVTQRIVVDVVPLY